MRRLYTALVIMFSLTSLLLGGSLRADARALQPMPAHTMRINHFYAITKAAFTAWNANSPAPARTRAFSAGTVDVAYYIDFDGMVAKTTTFQIVIYDHTGATYAKGSIHTFPYAGGEYLNIFGGGGPFDNGAYRMDLLVSGIMAATTTFTVGAAPTPISTAHAIGKRINAFYTITKAAYDAWTTNSPAPARTRVFHAGTTDIGYYIDYQGMVPNITTFQIAIYDHTGAAYVTSKKRTFPYARGEQLSFLGGGSPFDNGTYRMDLIIHGIVAASSTFTVGG